MKKFFTKEVELDISGSLFKSSMSVISSLGISNEMLAKHIK